MDVRERMNFQALNFGEAGEEVFVAIRSFTLV